MNVFPCLVETISNNLDGTHDVPYVLNAPMRTNKTQKKNHVGFFLKVGNLKLKVKSNIKKQQKKKKKEGGK